MPPGFDSLVVVVVLVAAAPVVVAVLPGRARLPQVVFLLVAGVLVGPQVLGWANPADVVEFAQIGLGFLFLLAGYELEPRIFKEHAGRLAVLAWLTSLTAAVVIISALTAAGVVRSFGVAAIALTTTALGTLLPIMRDNGMLDDAFGRFAFAAGAAGELGPVLAMAVFLGSKRSAVEVMILLGFAGVAYLLAIAPRYVGETKAVRIILDLEHGTAQTTLRLTIALLFLLLLSTGRFGLDVVLGGFLAGMVLRQWSLGQTDLLEAKLDAVGYGFFIPIFFVQSGMTLDVRSIVSHPLPTVVFLGVFLVVRGLPALWLYRGDLDLLQRVELVFLTATTLPMLVALTDVGVSAGTMSPIAAASLVGAGVLSVAIFPLVAVRLHRRGRPSSDPVRA